jgi:transcriptional regulator with XRE-family HTH domain
MPRYRDILQRLVSLRQTSEPRVTQGKLGELLHVKQSTMSAWETGTNLMGLDEMTAYAEALGHTLRVELAPKGKRPRAEELYDLVEAMPEEEYREIARMIRAAGKASADARFMVIGLLEGAVKGRDGR